MNKGTKPEKRHETGKKAHGGSYGKLRGGSFLTVHWGVETKMGGYRIFSFHFGGVKIFFVASWGVQIFSFSLWGGTDHLALSSTLTFLISE